jgi:hypothetical protein
MNVKYKYKEIYKRIFLVTIDDPYDLAMTFCRVQEFYESALPQIKGKKFSMTKFQRLYAKKYGDGVFTYPRDWAGFNVPSKAIWDLYNYYNDLDINYYDKLITDIDDYIQDKLEPEEEYYLIGAASNDKETIRHEVTHGFYYLNKDYRNKVNFLIKKINKKLFSKIKNFLNSVGYCNSVILDEINAYFSTDSEFITDHVKMNAKEKENFVKIKYQLIDIFNSLTKN